MTRSTALTFAILLAAGPAAAQSTSTPTTTPASPGAARHGAVEEVKIAGCLRSTTAAPAGSAAPATAQQAMVFTLDVAPPHAPSGAPQSSSSSAEAGGVGTSGHDLQPATYTLTPAATARVDLGAHVNHMVQLTGRMREAAGPSTAARAQTPPSREMPEATDPTTAATTRTFEVTGVQAMSGTCPAK